MTQEFLQDAMVADLKELFAHERLKSSLGVEREIQIYPQDVPIRESDDEAQDKEAPAGAVCDGAPPGWKDRKRR